MERHNWAGEEWEIHGDRALYWPARRTLLIADPHFGKTGTFHSAGIPIPAGVTAHDLLRLDRLVSDTSPDRLVILGDFFHHKSGMTEEMIEEVGDWFAKRSELDVLLVMGNHDVRSGKPPGAWGFQVESKPFDEPGTVIRFAHFPKDVTPGRKTLAGHLHPAVRLQDRDGSGISVPCFHFSADVATLPAFSVFTGTAPIRPSHGDAVFGLFEGQVARLNLDVEQQG